MFSACFVPKQVVWLRISTRPLYIAVLQSQLPGYNKKVPVNFLLRKTYGLQSGIDNLVIKFLKLKTYHVPDDQCLSFY